MINRMAVEISKNKARDGIFWLGMPKDIEDPISNSMDMY